MLGCRFCSIYGGTFVNKEDYDKLFERVEQGASLYVSAFNAQFCEFEKKFGLRSLGMAKKQKQHTAHFPFGSIEYFNEKEILLEANGAEVLAANEEGNPVFTKHRLGKGFVYLLNFSLEQIAAERYNAYDESFGLYKVYQLIEAVEKAAGDYLIRINNPCIGVTESACQDGYIVTAVNYSNKTVALNYSVKKGYVVEIIYGNSSNLRGCDAAIFKVSKGLG